jgi:predicted nucleic acid-binding protein
MKAVVDTNVVAYYLLGTVGFAAEVQQFWRCVDDALAPALWEAELANVVWMSVRAGVLAAADAPGRLALAARLGVHSVPTRSVWHGALLRAVQTGVAVYDTLFVELAERENAPLATFDRRLLAACPGIAYHPKDLVD